MHDSLRLVWTQAPTKYVYWYGETNTRFSAQIGLRTKNGPFAWNIFHEDFQGPVGGGEAQTVDEAQLKAQEWLAFFAKPKTNSN